MFSFKRFFQGKGFSDRGARGQRAGRKGGSRFLGRLQNYLNICFSYSRRRYQSERGIAIPLVIGIGLLMTLLSITIIVRSQSSQINSSNLNQAATAGEIAETGVTRIQSIFASNRTIPLITLYDVGTNSNSWEQAGNSAPPSSCSGGGTTIVPLANFRGNTWTDIEPGKRQYRVVKYTYFPTSTSTSLTFTPITITTANFSSTQTLSSVSNASYISSEGSAIGQIASIVGTLRNTSGTYTFKPSGSPTASVASVTGGTFSPITDNGTGRLQVEGRIINGTVGVDGKTVNPPQQVIATSGIEVEIPVTPGDINNIPIPGTWLGAAFAPSGNQTFASDVLVPCNEATSDVPLEPRTPPYTANKTALKLPEVPPTPSTAYNLGSLMSTNVVLPLASGASPSGYNPATGGYEYIASGIASNNDTLTIDPNYKVSIYLTGNINMGGSGDIVHKSTSNGGFNSVLPTGTVTVSAATSISSASGVTVVPSNTSYLNNNQSVKGVFGVNGIPGRLSRSGTTYTFTPLTAPTPSGTITVAAGSTFTPRTAAYRETDLKIYGNGSTVTSPHICLSGNASIDAFILAPSYSFGMNGGGNGTAISGAIWTGSYPSSSCSSSSNKVIVFQNATWDDVGLSPQNLPPSVAATQTWNKKKVTD